MCLLSVGSRRYIRVKSEVNTVMKTYNRRWAPTMRFLLEHGFRASGSELALTVGVSSRTIRSDIRDLNIRLADYGAEVLSEIGVGYRLQFVDESRLTEFLEELRAQEKLQDLQSIVPSDSAGRVRFLTLQLMLSALDGTSKLDVYALADQLFVSDSTLRKDLRAVRKKLQDYGLRISETKAQGLHVVGDEAKIRFCISNTVFSDEARWREDGWSLCYELFAKADVEAVKLLVADSIAKHGMRLTDIAFKNLVIHTLIMLKRSKVECHVDYDSDMTAQLEGRSEFRCAEDIIDGLARLTGEPLSDEALYLCQHLIASQRVLVEGAECDLNHDEVLDRILEQIEQTMHVDLYDDMQLRQSLALHLSAALERLRFDMNIRNDFIDTMKATYPLAFELATIAGEVIESEYSIASNEAELGYLAMHFGVALERKGLRGNAASCQAQPRGMKRVALVCAAGRAISLLLRERLSDRFAGQIEIVKTCSASEVDGKLLDQVDAVLTTVELPMISSAKVKRIELFPSEEELQALTDFVLGEVPEQISYTSIFKKELFFPHMKLRKRDEILDFMTRSMIERGYMNEQLRESVFKREELSTTEVGGLLAIPHSMLSDIESFAVSILILDRPVIWKRQRVQVVLLLNIPQKNFGVWEQVFKSLYDNLIVNAGVSKLIRHQDYEKFMRDLEDTARCGVQHS